VKLANCTAGGVVITRDRELDRVYGGMTADTEDKTSSAAKLSLCKHDAMKTYWDTVGIAPRIHNHVGFTPRPLYPPWRKSTRYPLHRRMDGPQSHPRCGGEEKDSLIVPARN